MSSHYFKPTVNQHNVYEAVSALQKAIRRGELDNALYWSTDLHLSGFDTWLWKRLLIITSEDVGPSWVEGPAVIRALHDTWKQYASKPNSPGILFIHHAVLLLCRANKTRVVDHAATVHLLAHEELYREVPDEALDKHTARGKGMGRGIEHFLDEASKVHPEAEDADAPVYKELERELILSGKKHPGAQRVPKAEQEKLELEGE
jgi:replication-associated recombination protein RarA